jgi:transposase
MAPLRGWGPSGQRLEASAPFGHWKTMTFIAALRHDRISAPWVIDGPINGELFTLYVEQVLAPTLAKGELVILDNLGSHKGKPARNAIRAKGAHLMFLPPYSPDLNPIEQVFAKLKHLMRAQSPVTSKQHGEKSANSSISSPRRSVPTISKTQGMFPYKNIVL